MPQWPLKSSAVLITPQQVQRARLLCERSAAARAVRQGVIGNARRWAAMPDAVLRGLLPDGRVPRADTVSPQGCPIHGKAIFGKSRSGWVWDDRHPFSVVCPIGGERYPSNDFAAFYASGMRDRNLLTGRYADDGWGWRAPDGEKYWFVAYACGTHWGNSWLPAITALSQAYALTGEQIYARKAIVMLDRIAEVYPGMDFESQSRLGVMLPGNYPGKIQNRFWEQHTLRVLTAAYDLVFDALIGEQAMSLPWRSAEQIRSNIEANLLEEGIDAIIRGQVQGGGTEVALAMLAAVRQHVPADLLDRLLEHNAGHYLDQGLEYALYNLYWKDGLSHESSFFYGFGWVNTVANLVDLLHRGGVEVKAASRLQMLCDGPLQVLCPGDFMPALGDGGDPTSRWVGVKPEAFEYAYRRWRRPEYGWALQRLGSSPGETFKSFEDLLKEPLYENPQAQVQAREYQHRPPSRVLDGLGMAILNNPGNTVGVSMYYGNCRYHAHRDRFNLELFGQGHRLAPDLGYPDANDPTVSGIYSWSFNTISHNTVVVSDKPQTGKRKGTVLRFHSSPSVQVVDIDGAGTYAEAEFYRRSLVLVSVGEEDGYVVDVFRVRGGKSHVLSIHGLEGEFRLQGAELPPPVRQGTLAGPQVAYGQLYDDPKLGAPGYDGLYHTYEGSGYQHFFNPQQTTPQTGVTAEWRVARPKPAQLRVHALPHAGQELTVADAYVSPLRRVPTILKYMLLRRGSEPQGNTFVTVWEPAGSKPMIDAVDVMPGLGTEPGSDAVVGVSVGRGDSTDLVVVSPEAGRRYKIDGGLESDAAVVVLTARRGQVSRVFAAGGSELSGGEPPRKMVIPAGLSGEIVAADYEGRTITVKPAGAVDPGVLKGRTARIFNSAHSCVYRIASAKLVDKQIQLALTGSDVITGRIQIEAVAADGLTLSTKTALLDAFDPAGMHLLTQDLSHGIRVLGMSKGQVRLEPGPSAAAFSDEVKAGQRDAWFADFGPGDNVEVEMVIHRLAGQSVRSEARYASQPAVDLSH